MQMGVGIAGYKHETAPTPIDFVAQAVVNLAMRHPEGGGVFHISSPQRPDIGFFERYNSVASKPLRLLPHYLWIQELKRLHEGGAELSAVPLMEFAFAMNEESFEKYIRATQLGRIDINCNRTYKDLSEAGILTPELENDHLHLLLEKVLAEDPDLRSPREVTQESEPSNSGRHGHRRAG